MRAPSMRNTVFAHYREHIIKRDLEQSKCIRVNGVGGETHKNDSEKSPPVFFAPRITDRIRLLLRLYRHIRTAVLQLTIARKIQDDEFSRIFLDA
jgi:hypothetical protein